MAEPADCDQVLQELYTFLDGELTGEVRAAIQGHLDGCADCGGAYDFEAELRVVIARKCTERVPDHLRLRVLRAIAEAQQHAGQPAAGEQAG
jgi:mycothiol system anti-sigma-R factor